MPKIYVTSCHIFLVLAIRVTGSYIKLKVNDTVVTMSERWF